MSLLKTISNMNLNTNLIGILNPIGFRVSGFPSQNKSGCHRGCGFHNLSKTLAVGQKLSPDSAPAGSSGPSSKPHNICPETNL